MAAVLSCSDTAHLSHRNAAALWGFLPYEGSRSDVTVPGVRRHRRGPIVVHGSALGPDDRAVLDQIPVTSVPRTLLDLAAVMDPGRLERAIEASERLELFDLRAIQASLLQHRGRRGVARLRAAVGETDLTAETRSDLERRFVALCRSARLPVPGINVWIGDMEVDAIWERKRLVVELDGYAFHKSRRSFELDRERDANLLLAGYRVLRITARRLQDDPASVVAAILLVRPVPQEAVEAEAAEAVI